MSGHDILVPLSIEHHFQSRVKYQRLGGAVSDPVELQHSCLLLFWNDSSNLRSAVIPFSPEKLQVDQAVKEHPDVHTAPFQSTIGNLRQVRSPGNNTSPAMQGLHPSGGEEGGLKNTELSTIKFTLVRS